MPASTSSPALPDPNGRRVPYPRGTATTLHLIEEQARATPDADALYYDGATLSYRELDRRANSLAAMLVDHGARRETLLPLLVSDGMELPLAMVAAMKAGVPFIPFDPGWPRERIGALLRGLGTDIAVVSPRTPAPAAGCARALVADHRKLDGTDAAPAGGRPGRTDLAYGFFTSGTTGLPKCTLNVHRGLLNRFLYMTRRFGAGHVALQNSRSVFDSSLWQLLWPLTMGGSVVMPRRDGLLDLERTVDQIGRHGVTITDFVPSIFTVLVDLLASDPALVRAAGSLRHVLLGGEAINVEAVRRFHGLLPGTAITNTYGPTEASIGSVFHTVTAGGAVAAPATRYPSAAPSTTPRRWSWTPRCGVWARARPARSSSAATAWGWATSATRSGPGRRSCPTPSPTSPATASTAPATSATTGPTAACTSWGGATTSSRCAGCGSNRRRSSGRC
ncbi:AMP-binding protein [Streptomyces radiopugnans]|nr:AMP-binding protein [Streptomyces radiopugnans]